MYDADALQAALVYLRTLSYAQLLAMENEVPQRGLALQVPGLGSALDVGKELTQIAHAGLSRLAKTELRFLRPLEEIVESGRNPAAQVRDLWNECGSEPAKFVEKTKH